MEHHGKAHRHHAKVASSTHGRMRIKVHREDRSPELFEHVKRHLEAQPGVGTVDVNAATGSVTIPYDHALQHREGIFGCLKDIDVVITETLHPPEAGEAFGEAGGKSGGLNAAVTDINRYIQRTIGVSVDMRLILPLGLAGAGLWSISRRGFMFESVPGWVFLWLAFDAFVRLHPEPVLPHGAVSSDSQ
jgi:hypothetical protein